MEAATEEDRLTVVAGFCKNECGKSSGMIGGGNTEVDSEASNHEDEAKVDIPPSILGPVRGEGEGDHGHCGCTVWSESGDLCIGSFETIFAGESWHESG